MNSRLLFVPALGLALTFVPHARAQDGMIPSIVAPGQGALDVANPTNVVNVDATNLVNLPTLLSRAGAISLGVSADDLDKNPAARDALLNYVGRGGTIFLHTNAAQIFGYRTVAARETTNRLVGQIYGRARAAVPFGTVPLLWSNDVSATTGAVRAPGINRVFYTLRPGDDLVVDHPAGTPLLQVSDGSSARPLYAAAIAPYGAGFAVFTPDFIDQTRGDGAAFARNLLKLVGDSRYVGIPQAAIVSGDGLLPALASALQNSSGQSAPLPGLGTGLPVAREGAMPGAPIARNGATNNGAMAGGAMNNGAMNNGAMAGGAMNNGAMNPAQQGPILLLTRAEASGFGAALQNAPQGRGAAALAILRARVALLNNDAQSAQTQLALAERLTPNTTEIPFLRGATAIEGAGFIGANLGDRVRNASLAANSFAAASRVTSVFSGTAGNVDGAPVYGDVTPSQLGVLGAQINRFSQVLALEPPLARVLGNGAAQVTVRYFEGDASLPFIAVAINALTGSEAFRSVLDGQEILLFPTPALYQNYRAASGLRGQNAPLPATTLGDVVDGRILMVTIPPGRPVAIGPGGVPRVFPLRPTSANLLARLEAYALFESYIGDGKGRVPAWMALGLANLADLTVNGDTVSAQYDQELRRFASLNGLLSPRQFNAQIGDSSLLAQAQATQLMRYFYAQFGTGRVDETLQRIGAGQNVDDALLATTGLNEEQLFRAWSDAQFNVIR